MTSGNYPTQKLTRRAWLHGGIALSAAAVSGCASLMPRNGIADPVLQRRAVIAGLPGIRLWGDEVPTDIHAALHIDGAHGGGTKAAFVRGANGQPVVNVLALSGGGTDGAFGAGVLSGWTARGTRPEFQVVTGVSAGAIIAPLAFLGSSYDRELTGIWTEGKLSDLIVFQGLSAVLGGSAAADTQPLAAAIAKHVTPRMLHAVAREYRKGRMLFVGTTNLDAQRPVVWNMGAIAASGHPDALELFRRVILASAAIPGLFPPVSIEVEADGKTYQEMHVDGGTTRNVFVTPFPGPFSAYDQFYPQPPLRRLFLLNNVKVSPETEVVTEQAFPIAARAISTLLKSQHVGVINLVYRRSMDDGADFNMIAVPNDFAVQGVSLGDPVYEKALYDVGYRAGRDGIGWVKQPPAVSVGKT